MCRCVFLSRWRGAKPRQYAISVWDIYLYALNTNPRNCLSMSYYLGALAGFSGMETHEEGKQTLAQKLIHVLKARYSRVYIRDFALFAFTAFSLLYFGDFLTLFFEGIAPLVLGCVIGGTALFDMLAVYALTAQIRRHSIFLLGELGVVEAIPTLSQQRYRKHHATLCQILSELTPAHYGAFDRETVLNLCRILEEERFSITLNTHSRTRCLLEALSKIGDSRAIPSVVLLQKYLAAREKAYNEALFRKQFRHLRQHASEDARFLRPPEPVKPFAELQARIASLLKTLEERRVQEELHDNLLRGSSAPQDTSELLRPITGKPEQEPPEQLLRGVNHE